MGYVIRGRTPEQQKGFDEFHEERERKARQARQSAERNERLVTEEAQAAARMTRLNAMPTLTREQIDGLED